MPETAGPGSPGPAGRPRHAAPDGAAPAPALPRTAGRARHRRRSRRAGLLVRGGPLALALVALAVVAALVPRLAGDDPPSAGGDPAAPSASAPEAPAPSAPAQWLAAALPGSTPLAASAGVREDLTGSGVPADRLRPAGDDAAGGLLAVVGPAPPGARVVARFDRPGGDGDLLVVDPRPGGPTAEERERREALAAALLANPTTDADPAVAGVLRTGEVDPRLLSLLAALTAADGVGIAALPPLPGEEDAGTPARRALLDALGGAPVPADPAVTERLQAWLAAQLPPFAPDDVEVRDDGVLVSFHYVSAPDTLVADAGR